MKVIKFIDVALSTESYPSANARFYRVSLVYFLSIIQKKIKQPYYLNNQFLNKGKKPYCPYSFPFLGRRNQD